jgi:hypothetical protein
MRFAAATGAPTPQTLTVLEGRAEAAGCSTAPRLSTSTPTVAARAQIFTDEPVQDSTVEVQGMSLTVFTHSIYS